MSCATANILAERLNLKMIMSFSACRARLGVGAGERAPAAPARSHMELCEIAEPVRGGAVIAVTDPGMQATRRRLPRVLSRMPEGDARREAAEVYARAIEKIGSVAGASAEGVRADGGAATNDGGVTTRIGHASTIATVEAVLSSAGAALVPGNRRGGDRRRPIACAELVKSLCVDGDDMKTILTRAGWSGHRREIGSLSAVAEACLEEIARALGLISEGAAAPSRLARLAR